MLADKIGVPVKIAGQEVVIFPDIIGTVPVTEQHEYVEIAKSTNTCAAIQMREADIEFVRQQFPKIPIYGLWQTLVASQKVDVNQYLQVVPMTRLDGFYVHADVGRILYSGNYDAGFFAADTDFRLNNAVFLSLDLESLTLPQKPAMLAREILMSRRQVYRARISKLTAGVFILCFLAFMVDFALQFVTEQQFATLVEQDHRLGQLRNGLTQLSENRLAEKPDQSRTLDRLAVILHDLDKVTFLEPVSFKKKETRIHVSAPVDPAILYSYVKSNIQPDGLWAIDFQL